MRRLSLALSVVALHGCATLAGVEDGQLAKDAGSGGGGVAGVGNGGTAGAAASSGNGGTAGAAASSGNGGSGAAGAGTSGGGTAGAAASSGAAGASGGGAGGAVSSEYAAAVLADGPVAYWRMGEASGTTAVDATGNGHDGLLKGGVKLGEPGALNGDSDTAMYFDGTSYVDVGDKLDFAGTASLSIEAWVHPQAGKGGYLGKGMYDQGYKGYFIADNDSTIQWVREGAVASPPVITFTTYSHVVGTYDGLNLTLYVNGAKAGSKVATNPITDHPNPFTIGQVAGWGKFVGWIDEVAVYDKALDAARIKAHYDAAKGN
jgi:hypothetical protein